MTLLEFSTSPLARKFPRGFEKHHSAYSGYLIGGYNLFGMDFAVALGFSSPSTLVPSEDCELWGIILHRLAKQGQSRWSEWIHFWAELVKSIFGPPYLTPQQWNSLNQESETHCRQWLKDVLGQEEDLKWYQPWGSIRLVTDDPRDGCYIDIRYQ